MNFSPDTLYRAFERMQIEGGSFARTLAHAWFLADGDNQTKIQETFSELISQYVDVSYINSEEEIAE